MKSRHSGWARLGLGWKAPKRPPIKIRDLPGFDLLAAKIRLYAPARGPWPPELDQAADDFTKRHFGVTREETDFQGPEDGPDVDWEKVEKQAEAYEARFLCLELNDEQTAEMLLRHGVDVRSEDGAPLPGLHLIVEQIEAAAKGIAGRLPDVTQVAADRFGEQIAADAAAFMAQKRGRR